jgi:hypothetical protein
LKTSPGRYSGQDNGWIGLYITSVMDQFWDELKTHPKFPISPSAREASNPSRRNIGKSALDESATPRAANRPPFSLGENEILRPGERLLPDLL